MLAGSVDTNVLVRLVAQDDALQAQAVGTCRGKCINKISEIMRFC